MKQIGALALLLGVALASAALAADEATQEHALATSGRTRTGDFDQMLELRTLRVLVPYSRTLFYYDRGEARGSTAQVAADLETRLNKKYLGKQPFTVVLIPTTRERLLPSLVKGEGDVAAGNITVTEARARLVDFTVPTVRSVSEIIVTGPGAPELKTLDDLAGQRVHVRPSTSYHESLVALNQRFAREGKPPMQLVTLPDEIESEDVLDMVDVGLIQISVIDDWLGNVWAPYLPNVKLHPKLAVRSGGQVAWALRKGSPKLKAELDTFIANGIKQGLDRIVIRRAAANAEKMQNATASAEMRKFLASIELFRKYGDQYGFDSLMLAAQDYQESRLDPTAGGIQQTEKRVQADSKHMAELMQRYFKDARFDEQNRTLFAFASDNAGPANIRRARDAAAQEGLNPDLWFNNVEHVAAKQIGQEPVQYVRNIYKYYVAYKLAQQVEAEKAKAIDKLKGGTR